jgi:hypothetical protein
MKCAPRFEVFLAFKRFHKKGFPGRLKIILGFFHGKRPGNIDLKFYEVTLYQGLQGIFFLYY